MNFIESLSIELLCIIQFIAVQSSIECQSRYYCRTDEVKYASMERIQNAYMNATPINTYVVSSISDCQKYCIRAEKCSSLNMKYNESNVQVCQLLDVNMFSNASLLVKNGSYTHLYIPSPCSGNPCLNGGTCVPTYANDSYKCECKSSNFTFFKGVNCEKTFTGYASAFLYWSFDDYKQKVPYTSSDITVSSYIPGVRRTGYEPGRKNPVAACIRKTDGGSCMQFWANIPCINNFNLCSGPVSYSIWMKFAELEAKRSRASNILATYAFGNSRGLHFFVNGDRKQGFRWIISIATDSVWDLDGFGKHITLTKWNHFVLTIDNNDGICAYVNGKKDICGGQKAFKSATNTGRAVRLAGAWYAGAALDVFFDDLAIWKSILSEKEVEHLYMVSKD